jgi:uncharacterized protein YndB with AHSA1/START domain
MSDELVVKKTYTASAERVFDAFLDPAKAGKFLFATPTGTMIKVEIDPRVGGQYNITRREDKDYEHLGEYLVIDRPHRLVFTLRVPQLGNVSKTVSIEIVPKGSGCELTLTHSPVKPENQEGMRGGWGKILDGLENAIIA